ncbi:hypothetical protein [Oerskovia flava]|uniref:hypothetical protein n=1 Tax=Oerskovia flava TaxID=2986422 RepID=UPI00223EFA00|nr:hypothetical protein [Oerskovia sp. JB1-3-2]
MTALLTPHLVRGSSRAATPATPAGAPSVTGAAQPARRLAAPPAAPGAARVAGAANPPLTIEWLVARDIDAYSRRRR